MKNIKNTISGKKKNGSGDMTKTRPIDFCIHSNEGRACIFEECRQYETHCKAKHANIACCIIPESSQRHEIL